ncbi:MAG: redoxin domain-containing protein [Pirellulaceae bacterium]
MDPTLSTSTRGLILSTLHLAILGAATASLHIKAAWAEDTDIQAGHSIHGEAFNEGPRQAAYLMPGMGNVVFEATTDNSLAQRFINQGVAQLHGFWYYEAERSFRQAAVHDPDCAITYWGMAMANIENRSRAKDLIQQAVDRKAGASRREQLFIDAYAKYCLDEDDKKKKIDKKARAQTYTRDLETIVEEFPDDIEAKAFLAVQLWMNARAELPIVSHVAIDALIEDIFDVNPMHPAHHYRIHLWDAHKAERALASAADCGPSLPGIAHMWHMPGHIYSKLHRYQDAVWQQEASARVDHAHMMRDRVLPDQIHNFAHNNEWLIRNLIKVGRVDDAIALAKNMQELPRHPKYNTLKRGSAKYGRERLLLTLSNYRLWPELIEFAQTDYLSPTDDEDLQNERLRHLGVAYALNADANAAADIRQELEDRLAKVETTIEELKAEKEQADKEKADIEKADKEKANKDDTNEIRPPRPESETTTPGESEVVAQSCKNEEADAKKALANRQRREKERADKLKKEQTTQKTLIKQIAAVRAAEAAANHQWNAALDHWSKSDLDDNLLKSEWLTAADKFDEAMKLVDKEISSKPGEVLPMATKAWIQFTHSGSDSARESFEEVKALACVADLDTPLLQRLLPLALALGAPEAWAADYKLADDLGARPDLDSLGPFRWHPYMAPNFTATAVDGSSISLKQLRGRPTLVIFYLGFGCLHCVEQLHEFSPRASEFRKAGIDIIAISSEDVDSLKKGISNYSNPLDIPLHADPTLECFKAYRCFDDFEQTSLHGTFLIDSDGRVLWQDISYEPFMDVEFAMTESQRLLKLADK